MVGLFVRLKLRILRNRLGGSSAWGVIGFVLVWTASLGAAVGVGLAMASAGRLIEDPQPIPAVVFTVVALGWIFGPLIAASFDDMLDPRRFELLPISRSQLGVGLTAAGLIGPGGVGTTIGLFIGTMGGFAGVVSAVPILITVVIEILLVVVTARFVLAALADLLRARRAREILGIALGLTAAIPGILGGVFNSGWLDLTFQFDRLGSWLAWTPPGALGRSVSAFAAGDWAVGLAGWAYGGAALGLVVWGYGRALDRLQVVADSRGESKALKSTGVVLRPARIPLPKGPVGAVAAKEFAYYRRDARLRGQMVGALVGLVVIMTLAITTIDGAFAPFVAVPMAFFMVQALLFNQFGWDTGAFWNYMVTVDSFADVLEGKNLAGGGVAGFGAILTAIVAGVTGGDLRYIPAAVLASMVVIAVWAAVGNATSVMAPVRLAETTGFTSQGMSGAAFVASMAGLAAAGIGMVVPTIAIVVAVWKGGPVWATVAAAGGLAYAVAVYIGSLRITGPMAERRLHAVLEIIDKD